MLANWHACTDISLLKLGKMDSGSNGQIDKVIFAVENITSTSAEIRFCNYNTNPAIIAKYIIKLQSTHRPKKWKNIASISGHKLKKSKNEQVFSKRIVELLPCSSYSTKVDVVYVSTKKKHCLYSKILSFNTLKPMSIMHLTKEVQLELNYKRTMSRSQFKAVNEQIRVVSPSLYIKQTHDSIYKYQTDLPFSDDAWQSLSFTFDTHNKSGKYLYLQMVLGKSDFVIYRFKRVRITIECENNKTITLYYERTHTHFVDIKCLRNTKDINTHELSICATNSNYLLSHAICKGNQEIFQTFDCSNSESIQFIKTQQKKWTLCSLVHRQIYWLNQDFVLHFWKDCYFENVSYLMVHCAQDINGIQKYNQIECILSQYCQEKQNIIDLVLAFCKNTNSNGDGEERFNFFENTFLIPIYHELYVNSENGEVYQYNRNIDQINACVLNLIHWR